MDLAHELAQTRVSEWFTVEQSLIDRFADVTGDMQFIHVDPVRAAETPFGGTIAHGFLLLSLLPRLVATMPGGLAAETPPGASMMVNYGFDRVRFVSPVRAGRRVRAHATPREAVRAEDGTVRIVSEVTLEVEGGAKPAMVASWVTLLVP